MSPTSAPSLVKEQVLDRHYVIHGYGGSPAVQGRLAQVGIITHVTWDPGPPAWRLHFDTALSVEDLQTLLGDLSGRFEVQVFESV